MNTAVYKLVLKGCEKCKSMIPIERETFGRHGLEINEVDFDNLERNSYLYQELEYLCEKHSITSVSFPFYIFSNENREPDYISGIPSWETLMAKLKEHTNEAGN